MCFGRSPTFTMTHTHSLTSTLSLSVSALRWQFQWRQNRTRNVHENIEERKMFHTHAAVVVQHILTTLRFHVWYSIDFRRITVCYLPSIDCTFQANKKKDFPFSERCMKRDSCYFFKSLIDMNKRELNSYWLWKMIFSTKQDSIKETFFIGPWHSKLICNNLFETARNKQIWQLTARIFCILKWSETIYHSFAYFIDKNPKWATTVATKTVQISSDRFQAKHFSICMSRFGRISNFFRFKMIVVCLLIIICIFV